MHQLIIKRSVIAVVLSIVALNTHAENDSLKYVGDNSIKQDSHLQPPIATPVPPPEAAPEILAVEEVDVWERMRRGFTMPDLENPIVNTQVEWYIARPDHIKRTTERASRYLFHVIQELEARGMPTELALLPFIESAFNPQAVSSAKAAGMWQFIPSTGQTFNLKQNIFKDERRDVLASTNAALNYLQKLYGMFGDWHLALAAYNWGEGSVQRAIKKNEAAGLPTDFNSLSALMPAETRNYVPKLQAIKQIVAYADLYGIALPHIENQPYFVTIGKTQDIDIKVAAQLAELSLTEFKALNPQFNRPVIAGGAKTKILLPHENAEKFKTNLAKWKQPLSSWTVFTVLKRERLENIAKLFQTTVNLLREINNIPPKMLVKAGSTLLVPKIANAKYSDISPEVLDTATLAVEKDAPPTKRIAIKTSKRDTLASIAKRYKVTIAQIKEWNKLSANAVSIGQRLTLHVPLRLTGTKNTSAKNTEKKPTRSKALLEKKVRPQKSRKVL